AQKAEVVLEVFQDVHEQEEIEVRILLLSDIRQLELQPFARQTARPRKGLRRDVVAPTAAPTLQSFMNQPEHLSGSAAHIADRGGRELVASDHLQNVLRLPRRFVGMPERVLQEVFAADVLVSNHRGCSLASRTSARRRAAPRVRSTTTRSGPAAATARVASAAALPTTSTSACASRLSTLSQSKDAMWGISSSMYRRFAPRNRARATSGSRMRTSHPFPMSVSTSVTMGLSRRSSVPGLKASPTTPILRFRVASTASAARRICPSFEDRIAASSGTETSAARAAYTRARRSFGRHEPPKAKPGRRYASETFSFRSIKKIRMPSSASAPPVARYNSTRASHTGRPRGSKSAPDTAAPPPPTSSAVRGQAPCPATPRLRSWRPPLRRRRRRSRRIPLPRGRRPSRIPRS